jgi:hypothetical protein
MFQNFVCLNYLHLYLNLHILDGTFVSHISIGQVIWPKSYLSANNYFMALMIKDKGRNTFLMQLNESYSVRLCNVCFKNFLI